MYNIYYNIYIYILHIIMQHIRHINPKMSGPRFASRTRSQRNCGISARTCNGNEFKPCPIHDSSGIGFIMVYHLHDSLRDLNVPNSNLYRFHDVFRGLITFSASMSETRDVFFGFGWGAKTMSKTSRGLQPGARVSPLRK